MSTENLVERVKNHAEGVFSFSELFSNEEWDALTAGEKRGQGKGFWSLSTAGAFNSDGFTVEPVVGQKNPQKYRKFKTTTIVSTTENIDVSTTLIPDVNASVADIRRVLEPLGLTLAIVKKPS